MCPALMAQKHILKAKKANINTELLVFRLVAINPFLTTVNLTKNFPVHASHWPVEVGAAGPGDEGEAAGPCCCGTLQSSGTGSETTEFAAPPPTTHPK